MSDNPMLSLRNFSVSFDTARGPLYAVRNVDIDVADGDVGVAIHDLDGHAVGAGAQRLDQPQRLQRSSGHPAPAASTPWTGPRCASSPGFRWWP